MRPVLPPFLPQLYLLFFPLSQNDTSVPILTARPYLLDQDISRSDHLSSPSRTVTFTRFFRKRYSAEIARPKNARAKKVGLFV